jgi:glycine cleavage system H lipoate-binding protein
MITIHDQFVPTASFNTVSTPLAITTISPASAAVSASNLDLTINGTGFSSTTTYAYWNGGYRQITYNSSTEIVMHLTAGDLSASGTQQILIGNYTTNTASSTCGVIAQTQFNVNAPAGASAVQLAPTSLTFGSQNEGTSSAAVAVTLTNSGTAALQISSIAVTGTNASSFLQSNNCHASVAASEICTISVTFAPQAAGALTASVTITDNAGTQIVPLSGTGVAVPPITLNPTSIAFGSQTVGVKTTVPVTVTNNSASTLTFTSIAITPAGTVSYTQTNNCGSSIAAAGTCTIQVSFDPQSAGAKNDFVTLTDSAGTQTVTLTGTGVAAGSLTLNPTSIAFGSQTVGVKTTTPVTVTNNSASTVTFTSIAITPTGTVSYTETNNCGSSLAAGGMCTIQVSFDPQSTGAKNDFVTLTDSAGTQTVTLTGTGVAAGGITLNPTNIAFGSQTVGVKTTVPVTVTNNSAATITFTSIAITPAGTVSYTQTNNCGSSIAAAGTCTIQVSFDPHSTGAKDDFVTLTDSAGTQTVTLTGTGVASGSIGLNPTSIAFGSLTVGVKTTVPVTVTNNSASAVTISSIAITPTGTVSYTETNNCGTSIAAGGTCTIQVSFDPQSAGTKTASVTLVDSAGTQTVALTGIGVASPIALNPTSIAFGSQTVGVKTTVPVTVTNNSAATITFTSIAITPAGTVSYTQTNNCGSSIAAAGTCAIQVSFDPQSAGAKNDFVTLTDSAGTQTVTLTGTGVAP